MMCEPVYTDPEYLAKDDTVRLYGELLSACAKHGLANPVQSELFLFLVEFKSLIDAFAVAYEASRVPGSAVDKNHRGRIAAGFRKNALDGNGIKPRYAAFVDYLSDLIEG